jgi:hypothetical protein
MTILTLAELACPSATRADAAKIASSGVGIFKETKKNVQSITILAVTILIY